MAKDKRFELVLSEGVKGALSMSTTILRDTVTGALYLMVVNGYGGGLTPLLNSDGTPMIWTQEQC